MSIVVPEADENKFRSHRKILQDAGQTLVFRYLAKLGFDVSRTSVVLNWATRDSIPGEYWKALAEGGFATLDELAAYAESKKVPAAAGEAAA